MPILMKMSEEASPALGVSQAVAGVQRSEAPSDLRYGTNTVGPHGCSSRKPQNASRPRERTVKGSVQRELALSTSKDQFGRQLVSTVAKPSKGQQAAASRSIKVGKDGGHEQSKVFRDRHEEADSCIVPEATATWFRQPGMTSQDSDALVFGVSSRAVSRSDLRADLMHDCITPDLHTHASQTPEDDRLVEADGQQTDLSNLSQKLSALNLQRLTCSVGVAEKPTTSLPPVLSTRRMMAPKSNQSFAKVAPTVPYPAITNPADRGSARCKSN
ncbi:hypothetical protein HRS9139_09126 [Pyrenophora teres f. teres]|nr:hypothetical protein HRS9139_09126 [Pyrenophora teres f. teres]